MGDLYKHYTIKYGSSFTIIPYVIKHFIIFIFIFIFIFLLRAIGPMDEEVPKGLGPKVP